MELYNTELRIYEIGLSQAPDIFSGQYNRRLECLFACLNATKSWVNMFLSVPPAEFVGFSTAIYSHMASCFVGIYRLSTFEHPEWDRDLFRENLDVLFILEEAEKKFAKVKVAAGLDLGGSEDIDFFNTMASKMRFFKTSWDAMTVSAMSSVGTAPSDGMGDFHMEFLDEDWLRDLLGPLNAE